MAILSQTGWDREEEAAIDMKLEIDDAGTQKGTGEARVVKGSLTSHSCGQLHAGGHVWSRV